MKPAIGCAAVHQRRIHKTGIHKSPPGFIVASLCPLSAACVVLASLMLQWSLGNVAYELLTGLPPFYCQGKPLPVHVLADLVCSLVCSMLCGLESEGCLVHYRATGDDIKTVEKIMKRRIDWPTGKNAIVRLPQADLPEN